MTWSPPRENDVRGKMRIEYFQLIDRIIELNPAELTIRAEATVPATSTIFEGHFPGRPLMPGVLLVESMAQASGWLIIAHTGFERMPFLAALKEVKLRTFVTPGQSLTVSAKIAHEGSGFVVTDADIKIDDKLICNAKITFRLVEFPKGEFLDSMHDVAKRIALPMGPAINV
jgi:3-hydroxyacyl-[acyl-carrier-protein] dehydratase